MKESGKGWGWPLCHEAWAAGVGMGWSLSWEPLRARLTDSCVGKLWALPVSVPEADCSSCRLESYLAGPPSTSRWRCLLKSRFGVYLSGQEGVSHGIVLHNRLCFFGSTLILHLVSMKAPTISVSFDSASDVDERWPCPVIVFFSLCIGCFLSLTLLT